MADGGSSEREGRAAAALERIQAALRGLRFGTVTAVVQDGVVTWPPAAAIAASTIPVGNRNQPDLPKSVMNSKAG